MRLNFLNHLEKWLGDANLRSSAIVSVKSEEIAKELELRVHLHEPRMKRVEMDVHTVRAGAMSREICVIDATSSFLIAEF